MLDKGFWADVELAGEHLRLFSEDNAQGVRVYVYDVNAKCWIVPSEEAEDIEQGKKEPRNMPRFTLDKLAIQNYRR
jgi:hypothetical protein